MSPPDNTPDGELVKVSGFTFLKNAQKLGYPFVASINSILPIVDEFVIALGPCDDQTEAMIASINSPKIRIIHTHWNETIRNDLRLKGFVFGQQKSVALFNCTGDWAFYLEGDEVLHEDDLPTIQESMRKHLPDKRVEALVFDYLHFYGNKNTCAWSPRWYRKAPRIIRNNIPSFSTDSLFFNVIENHRRARYPRAAVTGATIYHYGWVRSEAQMNIKHAFMDKFFRDKVSVCDYSEIDSETLRLFTKAHPKVVQDWLPPAKGLFQANPGHRLTKREKKHRLMLKLERWLGMEFSKKHYQLVR
jgi:hypothetical protein